MLEVQLKGRWSDWRGAGVLDDEKEQADGKGLRGYTLPKYPIHLEATLKPTRVQSLYPLLTRLDCGFLGLLLTTKIGHGRSSIRLEP